MAKKIELSPCLEEFVKAIASDTDVTLASNNLKDRLRKAHVGEITQLSITKEVYGVQIYVRGNNGHETTAKVQDVHGNYDGVKLTLKEFVKKYNDSLRPV